jgi:hypothetical protein
MAYSLLLAPRDEVWVGGVGNVKHIRLDMIREAFVGYGALVQHLGSL